MNATLQSDNTLSTPRNPKRKRKHVRIPNYFAKLMDTLFPPSAGIGSFA